MSLKFRDKNGAEHVLAGLTPGGDIEYGAVAIRKGNYTISSAVAAQTGGSTTITFSEPMPDNDYEIIFNTVSARLALIFSEKTVNGFKLSWFNTSDSATAANVILSYTAFKLYTVADAEVLYSSVQDIEDMIPANASSTNKFATADDLRTDVRGLDRRLDDVEDCVPSSASVSNQLVTQSDLDNVTIEELGEIQDVDVSGVTDGQTIVYDGASQKWVNGQGGKVYSAGDGISISNTDEISAKVDDTSITTDSNDALKVADSYKTAFVGTKSEWDALTTEQKKAYKIANITDDVIGGEVADAVADGDMRPVTSNAVYDGLATKVSKSDVVDNLTSTSTTAPLSAAQGKKLNEKFTYRQFSDTTEYTLTGSSSGRTPQLVWTISNLAVTKGIYLIDCYVQSLSGLGGPVNFYIGTLNPTVGTNNGIPSLYHTIYAGAAYSVMRDIKTIPIDSDQTISIYVGIDIMANSSCKVTNKWLTFTKIADATS